MDDDTCLSEFSTNPYTDLEKFDNRVASYQNGGSKMEMEKLAQALTTSKIKRSLMLDGSHESAINLQLLKPIFISDLRIGDRHYGNYIILRSLSMPSSMDRFLTVAEDEKRDQITVEEIVSWKKTENPDAKKVCPFKKGVVFLIKEPIFKGVTHGVISLLAHVVSDIIILNVDIHQEYFPKQWNNEELYNSTATAEEWRKAGNDAVERKYFWDAIECYTAAFRCYQTSDYEEWLKEGDEARDRKDYKKAKEWYTIPQHLKAKGNVNTPLIFSSPSYKNAQEACKAPDERATILRNRAFAHLKVGLPASALKDTLFHSTSELYPNASPHPTYCPEFEISEKGLYRAALAAHALRRFVACRLIVKTLQERHPGFVIPDPQLHRLDARIAEEKRGKYDWAAMAKEAIRLIKMNETNRPPPDLDFATFVGPVIVKDCYNRKEKGLFTTKAVKAGSLLCCEKALACVYKGTPGVEYDDEDRFTQAKLAMEITQKLRRNPKLLREFSTLYKGDDVPVSLKGEDGMPIVDAYQVEKIVNFNNFSSSLRTAEPGPECYGMWLLASRVNHSCTSNARRGFIGDFLIARATKDIPKDKEITWPYYKTRRDIDDVQTELAARGFRCTCGICIEVKSTPAQLLIKRKKILQTLKILLNGPGVIIKRVEQLLIECEKTYPKPATEVPRMELAAQCRRLMEHYEVSCQEKRSAVFAIRYLEYIGFLITGGEMPAEEKQRFKIVKWGLLLDPVVVVFGLLNRVYAKHAPQLAQQLSRYMKMSWTMIIGEENP